MQMDFQSLFPQKINRHFAQTSNPIFCEKLEKHAKSSTADISQHAEC